MKNLQFLGKNLYRSLEKQPNNIVNIVIGIRGVGKYLIFWCSEPILRERTHNMLHLLAKKHGTWERITHFNS